MGKRLSARLSIVALLGLSAVNAGCSLIFVKPPEKSGRIVRRDPKCTSSRVAPVLDSVFTGLQLLRTGLAATADKSVYEDPNQPLSREADIGLGIGFTALFLGSAIYGFSNTSQCAAREEASRGDEEEDSPGTEDSPGKWPSWVKTAPAPAATAPANPAAPVAPKPADPATPAATQAAPAAPPSPPAPATVPAPSPEVPNAPPGSPVDAGQPPVPEAPNQDSRGGVAPLPAE